MYKTTTFNPGLYRDKGYSISVKVVATLLEHLHQCSVCDPVGGDSCFISCKFHQSPQAIFNNAPTLGSQDDGIRKSNVFAYNLTIMIQFIFF